MKNCLKNDENTFLRPYMGATTGISNIVSENIDSHALALFDNLKLELAFEVTSESFSISAVVEDTKIPPSFGLACFSALFPVSTSGDFGS